MLNDKKSQEVNVKKNNIKGLSAIRSKYFLIGYSGCYIG